MSSLIIKKIDANTREPLADAEFTVKTAAGALVGVYRSNTDGTITVPELIPGWYSVSETRAPEGYVLSDNVQTVEIKHTETVALEFENHPLGNLIIMKTDASTGAPLADTTFTVERSNGEKIGTFKTDISGKIIVSGLTEDTYIISETAAPDGYILDETSQTVRISSGKPVTVKFSNKPLAGLKIIKLDSVSRKPIKGVEFVIAHMDGAKVENDSRGYTFKTDKSGQIYIPGLADGYYTVTGATRS
jgi:uncharacterized surface anchored protein